MSGESKQPPCSVGRLDPRVEATLGGWHARHSEPVSPELDAAAQALLEAVEGGLASPDVLEVSRGWVERCQGANLSLFHALSLFTEYQLRAPSKLAALAGEGALLAALFWQEGLEAHLDERMQQGLAAQTAALQNENRRLREILRGRADFISMVSHELRTPLTSISGACELLLEDFASELSGRQDEFIVMIQQGAGLIKRLIDDVLDFEKLEARRLELNLEPLDVRELVDEIVAMVEPLRAERDMGWDLALDADLPLVTGDPIRVRQILLNLVSNALKFSKSGGRIEIRASLEKGAGRRSPMLALSVRDHGPGIAPEHQKAIFERFRQARATGQGTGLGLPIARRLAELHGGRLLVKSVLGEGATFTFTLPLRS